VISLVKHAVLFLTVCALWGCSSATPVTRYYLLSNPDQGETQDTSCSVQVGSVTVAPYLQRTHIVLQSGTNELIPAVQHRWSEPLEAGVRRLLSQCLVGDALSKRKANVQIEHLHGNTNGTVVIQANWSLDGDSAAGGETADIMASVKKQFSASTPQPKAGYDSLVTTQRALVLELCADIKAVVSDC